jgi:hypothetical protein
LDVTIFYLVDDEKLLIHADPDLHDLRLINNVLCVLGYLPKLFGTATSIRTRRQKGLKVLPIMLDIMDLRASMRRRCHVSAHLESKPLARLDDLT